MAAAVAGGQPKDETARAFGVSFTTVLIACKENGVPIHDTPSANGDEASSVQPAEKRRRGRPPGTGLGVNSKWRSVDWTLRDVDIAVAMGVTRERVRQVRKKLGEKAALYHRRHYSALYEWVDANRQHLEGLTTTNIKELAPIRCHLSTISKLCKSQGISTRRPGSALSLVTKQTLLNFVDIKPSGCWEWKFERAPLGYGRIGHHFAHRHVYTLYHGAPPLDKPCVLHTCDNPPCVNPEHLYAGTSADNSRDRVVRGRSGHKENLTPEQASEIRKRFAAGEMIEALAQEHNRSWQAIWNLIKGRTYRDASDTAAA